MASLRKRQSSNRITYQVRWREDGIARSETFDKYAEAVEFRGLVDAAGQRLPAGYRTGRGFLSRPDESVLTLDEWAPRAIDARARANTRTKADYHAIYGRHIQPTLGSRQLRLITPEMCGTWLSDLKRRVKAAKTAHNIAGLLSTILNDAVANSIIPSNPMQSVGRSAPVKREEMCFLTRQEFTSLLHGTDPHYQPLVLTLATTGMRWGEATALTVADVDLLAQPPRLAITKAWKKDELHDFYVGETKTGSSYRTVTIDDDTRDALIPLVTGRSGSDLLFATPAGGRIKSQTFHDAVWAPAVVGLVRCPNHAGQRHDRSRNYRIITSPCGCPGTLVKRPRIHDLRHTHVAWLIAAGVPLPAIQRRLGHSTITTTIDRYGHLMPELDTAITNSMRGLAALGQADSRGNTVRHPLVDR